MDVDRRDRGGLAPLRGQAGAVRGRVLGAGWRVCADGAQWTHLVRVMTAMPDDDRLFDDLASLNAALALEISTRLADAAAARPRASLVATGGTTPGPLYDALARTPAPWERVELTLTDERWVEPESPASNEHLVRTRLLVDRAAAAEFVPLKSSDATPRDAE